MAAAAPEDGLMGGPFVPDPMLSARHLQVRLGDRTVLASVPGMPSTTQAA